MLTSLITALTLITVNPLPMYELYPESFVSDTLEITLDNSVYYSRSALADSLGEAGEFNLTDAEHKVWIDKVYDAYSANKTAQELFIK